MFKLKVGDVCHIKKRIPGLSWKCGFYRVKLIRPYFPICDVTKPSENVYRFEKIKKDGTPYKTFADGYNCMFFDKKISAGEVTIIENNSLKEEDDPTYRKD
jgi:hypothetical protein